MPTVTTTRKGSPDSATYVVLVDGKPTMYTISRNDNESSPGGSGLSWWVWNGDFHDEDDEYHTKREALAAVRKAVA